jgi:hypothetical protein
MDTDGAVTLSFPTIRAAEQTFRQMLNSDVLKMSAAMPAEVAWISERMNR